MNDERKHTNHEKGKDTEGRNMADRTDRAGQRITGGGTGAVRKKRCQRGEFSVVKHGLVAIAPWLLLIGVVPAAATQPIIASGYGTAVIDGTRGATEWQTAGTASFPISLPAGGGGTATGTLYVMNDSVDLFLGLEISGWDLSGSTAVYFFFDDNNNGVCDGAEDNLLLAQVDPTSLQDGYCSGAGCGTCLLDTSDSGTSDGAGWADGVGTVSFWEFSHPLADADVAHDFHLSFGNTVGYYLRVWIVNGISMATTNYPSSDFSSLGGILIAAPQGAIFSDGFESGDLSHWLHNP